MQHTARTELFDEFGVFGIKFALGFLFGIEMVEIAEKLIETVGGWLVLIAVAQVGLAELSGDIPMFFQ